MFYSLVTQIKEKMTGRKIGTQITFHSDMTSKMSLYLFIPSADAGAITISSSESGIYMVISLGNYMQG